MGHRQKSSANSHEESLNVFDLESLNEEKESKNGSNQNSALGGDTATASTSVKESNKSGSSVFDRLYTTNRKGNQEPTTVKPESTKQPKGGKNSKAQAGKLFRNREALESKAAAVTEEPDGASGIPSIQVQGENDPQSQKLSVYDRLYRSTNQPRKGSRRPANVESTSTSTSTNIRRLKESKRSSKVSDQSSEQGSKDELDSEQENTIKDEDYKPNETGDSERNEDETLDEEPDNVEEEPTFNFFFGRPSTAVRSAKPVLKSLPSAQNTKRKKRKPWTIQRIPMSLVERTSLVRGALPVLPLPLAWLCLILNGIIPGLGTIFSGLSALCCGAPRFSGRVTSEHRFLALVVNMIIGLFQAMTILFCLVGWCWSLGWGIILIKNANQYKLWKKASSNDDKEENIRRSDDDIATIDSHEFRPRY